MPYIKEQALQFELYPLKESVMNTACNRGSYYR